jgi:hypothetical protein
MEQKVKSIGKAKPDKRLYRTIQGHYHQLMADFIRSASHKLPSAKGRLREAAVANFLSSWIPKRYTPLTNAFATTLDGNELPAELDLVVHDGYEGVAWPLDDQGANCVVTWEQVCMVVEVKSTLDREQFENGISVAKKVKKFADENPSSSRPLVVLFAFQVDADFVAHIHYDLTHSYQSAYLFDAVILLDEGAYFSDSFRELRLGIERGLAPNLVANDGPSQDRIILEDCEIRPDSMGYKAVGDCGPEITLLAFAAIATAASSGDDAVQALLSACKHVEYNPIFPDGM